MLKFDVKIDGLKEFKKRLREAPKITTKHLNIGIRKSIVAIERQTKARVPVRTGRLRASFRSEFRNLFGNLFTPARYGIFVHEGTKPHLIFPIVKRALFWRGAEHPVKVVRHPGTRGRPFLKEGVEKTRGEVNRYFKEALENIAKELAKNKL